VTFSVSVAEASDAGQRSIEHMSQVMWGCSSQEHLRKKFHDGQLSPKNANWEAYSEQKAAELFARFVKNGTWVCPTLTVLSGPVFQDERDLANDPRLEYMPLPTRRWWKNYPIVARAKWAWVRKRREQQLVVVGAMRRAGVGLLAGTNVFNPYSFPGFGLHDELALFVQAGLSPMEALRTATYNPAKFFGKLDSMGTIEQGKIADLVLLEANPLQDISNTQEIAAVVFGGKIYQTAALQKMLAQVKAAHLHDPEPERFAQSIAAFAEQDSKSPFSRGGIVFVGSSSVRMLDIPKFFPGLKAINRGFDGAHISDLNHYIEETVLKYEPSKIIFFCGGQDLWEGKSVLQVREDFENFKKRLFERVPDAELIVLGIRLSPSRIAIIDKKLEMNAVLNNIARDDKRITYLSGSVDRFLDEDGQPIIGLYADDRLHMNDAGYRIWAEILAPFLP
jgi:lysophospholipase L1-like esterase